MFLRLKPEIASNQPVTNTPQFYFPDVPVIPLPEGHRFPSGKYALLRAEIDRDQILGAATLQASPTATRDHLLRAHDSPYVDAMLAGTVAPDIQRRIGLPWSETLVARSRSTVGGAIASGRAALQHGISGQLAGGTHHAHRSFGSGFCVFNDLATATLTLLDDGLAERVAILDTDVHQGDGNSAILGSDPRVFVCSIQGEKNFPFRRVPSTLDFDLPDGTGDDAYLATLATALDAVTAFRPDLVFFLSGADTLKEDRLGRLDLTHTGMMQRDLTVFAHFKAHGIPVAIAIGGGYAEPIHHSVTAYANTFRAAAHIHNLTSTRTYTSI
ncbi:MAG: histone deacetylase [Hyphomicrobiaceae bacterium]|nr:histone deacetylase [Hyphomicrobiaceae bacterium]